MSSRESDIEGRGEDDFPLPEQVRGAIMAQNRRVSGECRINQGLAPSFLSAPCFPSQGDGHVLFLRLGR